MSIHDHIVKIYVPSTSNVIESDLTKAQHFTDYCLTQLARMFGGATAQQAQGAWISPVHGLVKEPIVIVFAFCSQESLDQYRGDVFQLAAEIAMEMKQEAVSVEIDNGLYFVDQGVRQAA